VNVVGVVYVDDIVVVHNVHVVDVVNVVVFVRVLLPMMLMCRCHSCYMLL